jgi:hypothetical protein
MPKVEDDRPKARKRRYKKSGKYAKKKQEVISVEPKHPAAKRALKVKDPREREAPVITEKAFNAMIDACESALGERLTASQIVNFYAVTVPV